ncbi:MAG TPA: SGNH/GDSL hydrolase family protein [Planctomycetaceae bacterium]|nr:SGNH/GDSL hydrolase family protein [Planctomycetaceae bacterium]
MKRLPLIARYSCIPAIALICISCLPSQAQQRTNPAMQPVKDTPGLPRVLLIGDSISIGYTVAVREALRGKANVHRPLTNCSSTKTGVAQMEKWLGDGKWDVIHFNFGLHDLKHVVGENARLVAIETEGSHRQISIKDYERNLTKILGTLKQTGAKLIFCTTTPVPEGAKGRKPADAIHYNEVARGLMKEHSVEINDLYKFAIQRLEAIQRKRDVHFTSEGSKILAAEVAKQIEKRLP